VHVCCWPIAEVAAHAATSVEPTRTLTFAALVVAATIANGSCFIIWASDLKYAPALHRAAIWDVGQDAYFPFKGCESLICSADFPMSESFIAMCRLSIKTLRLAIRVSKSELEEA
jgi:hypothetical protein